MKFKFSFFLAALAAILFTSCETTQIVTKQVAPPYTSVDRIVNLKQGMTMSDVSKTLGIEAYDVYHIQEDGSSILVYNYRIKDRITELPNESKKREEFLHGESFQNSGTPYYRMESSRAYILYKDGKMKSVITDEGKINSEFLMLINGNLKLLSKEDLALLNIVKIENRYVMKGVKDAENTVIHVKDIAEKETIIEPVAPVNTKDKQKGCLMAGGVVAGIALLTTLIVAAATY